MGVYRQVYCVHDVPAEARGHQTLGLELQLHCNGVSVLCSLLTDDMKHVMQLQKLIMKSQEVSWCPLLTPSCCHLAKSCCTGLRCLVGLGDCRSMPSVVLS